MDPQITKADPAPTPPDPAPAPKAPSPGPQDPKPTPQEPAPDQKNPAPDPKRPAPDPKDPDRFPNPLFDGKDGKSPDATGAPADVSGLGEEDYAKAVVADKDAGYSFDAEAVKAMVPALKEAGLTPEQSNRLANAYARHVQEQADADIRARNARCEAFDKEVQAIIRERPHFADEAMAGLEHYAKERPDLRRIFLETELSHDPAVLRMLADLGRMHLADRGTGTASGVGRSESGFAAALSRGLLK